MTTANFMNVSSAKGNFSMQVNVSKKLEEENLEVAEIFAGLMNQTLGFSDSMMSDNSSNDEVLKTNRTQSPVGSYERYSYKDKQIDTVKEYSVEEQFEEAGEVLEEAGEKVMDTLREKYGVDEETVQNLLDDMGLGILDLLNPQNLVNFIVQLTGVASGEELLLDENFLSVMETLNHLNGELMHELNVDADGLQELVAQMEVVADSDNESEKLVEEVDIKQVTESETTTSNEVEITKAWMNDSNDAMAGQQSGENFNANETIVQTQTTTNVGQAVDGATTQQFSSYLSADSMQIMEQIVQQVRVTISNEVKTMEMQMNPENLGKVYVNISSEEGVVNAQFRATNEIVKEALETQIATLRESLNQAGVKVDAIEVTIASHEFERNLEQNQQNSEEQMNAQEENTKKRRNLSVDSLDELTGVMTEEETLVAQIMKDNGNSVDFIA